ncbi:MAG TPA: hypothetical protein VIR15_07150 [Intrasporangium sp.]|jgi:hypothetical protein|uniref:hypothetical protein n=1 Tax=Intrasporangium sp. TaxID=1925024 RepID=UPI002F935181
MSTREYVAHMARLRVDNAATSLSARSYITGTQRVVAMSDYEAAALSELREALADLYSLATMTDDEFEVAHVDPTPDTQEQVTTPPEVYA